MGFRLVRRWCRVAAHKEGGTESPEYVALRKAVEQLGNEPTDYIPGAMTNTLLPGDTQMLEMFMSNPAVSLLKKDHARVKQLFDRFEAAKGKLSKKKIAREALTELKVHAAIEEELFYPAVRKSIGKEIMNEADEEHHVAKLLIAELESMKGSESHFDAKFMVLAENVRHHIKEEENEMLPKAKAVKIDFDGLAEKMKRRKERLLTTGVPSVGEETMVKASRGKGDSPAKAAKRNAPKGSKRKNR